MTSKRKTADQPDEAEVPPPAEAAVSEERHVGDEPAEPPKRPFQAVRGWTQRLTGPVQYRKLTDANLKIIFFKFEVGPAEKLPDDVLAVMRSHKQNKDGHATGLKFQDTRTHGKIWTVPNDVEGRALADKIDFQLSELAEKLEGSQGKAPF